jgi:hypothetical protein
LKDTGIETSARVAFAVRSQISVISIVWARLLEELIVSFGVIVIGVPISGTLPKTLIVQAALLIANGISPINHCSRAGWDGK